jgi:hypothetical protein
VESRERLPDGLITDVGPELSKVNGHEPDRKCRNVLRARELRESFAQERISFFGLACDADRHFLDLRDVEVIAMPLSSAGKIDVPPVSDTVRASRALRNSKCQDESIWRNGNGVGLNLQGFLNALAHSGSVSQ